MDKCGVKIIYMVGDSNMNDWDVLYKELIGQHDYIKPNPPATQKQILDVEKIVRILSIIRNSRLEIREDKLQFVDVRI